MLSRNLRQGRWKSDHGNCQLNSYDTELTPTGCHLGGKSALTSMLNTC